MIEHIGRVNMDFMVRLASDPTWACEELEAIQAYNAKHGALYGEDPVPVSVKPNFISPRQDSIIKASVRHLIGALDRFIEAFLASEQLQELWGVSQEELELYNVDPGYEGAIQVSRFDGFLRDHDLKFLEFNCDSPGGAGYAEVIHEAFNAMCERNPGLDQGYDMARMETVSALSRTLTTCYEGWRRERAEHPRDPFIVVTDWTDVGSRPDIDITVDRFQQAGLDAVFADPRELNFDGQHLQLDGRQVDLVYKRVIVKELLEAEEANGLLEAYKAGAVCMVNPPRSVIVGNKKIMAALRLPEVREALTPEQRRAVDTFVPWTEILRDARVDFQGYQVDLKGFVVDNKDSFVLKAARSYGGMDVHLGFETPDHEWLSLIEEHMDDNDWIVQELVEIPRELHPKISQGGVRMELMNVNLNPFVFGGQYAGAYTRISKHNIINVSSGGGLTPTIPVAATEDVAGDP